MVVSNESARDGSPVPTQTKSYAKIPHVLDIPNLIRIQVDSYDWFKNEGLQELLEEISPIQDFTGNRMELRFAREISPADRHENPETWVGLIPLDDVKSGRRTLAKRGEPLTLDTAKALRQAKLPSLRLPPYSF